MTLSYFEIAILNRQALRLSKTKLLRQTQKILHLLGYEQARLSLVFVNDFEIRRLHRRYLGQDSPTDVLAFEGARGLLFSPSRIPDLGEVVISVETARRWAPEFGNRWDEELFLYLIHGILHLKGYRDSTVREKLKMQRKEKEILKKALGPLWRSKRRKPLF